MKIPTDDIFIYGYGMIYCSVCVPKDMSKKDIEKRVNEINPTGIASKWILSNDKLFSDKVTSNPCVCERDIDRLHYLMEC